MAEEFKPLQQSVREAKILAEAQPQIGAHYKTSYMSVFMLKHGDLFLLQMVLKTYSLIHSLCTAVLSWLQFFFLLPRMIKVSLQGLGILIKCKLKHECTEDHNIQ